MTVSLFTLYADKSNIHQSKNNIKIKNMYIKQSKACKVTLTLSYIAKLKIYFAAKCYLKYSREEMFIIKIVHFTSLTIFLRQVF